ncbi:MAG: ABC transporter substrate-binding protein, partial [Candidatus Thorarchaeota archaeon]
MRFRYIAIVFLFCAFLTMSSVHVTTAEPSELMFENTVSGPYLDKVRYQVISSEDQRILALQSDAIDIIDGPISFAYHSILELDPEIELSSILRNGYGHITINCAKNPLNYSVLRRAFAFAFDKTLVPNLVDGVDQMHDSIVPYVSSYCYEDEFDWHYYDNQSTLANQMLNEAGFAIDGGTGFRLTPFGDAFDIVIAYSPSFPPGGGIAQLAVDTLASLHIDASSNSDDFNTIIANVQNHGDYDMVFYGSNFYSDDVDWLANEYYSAYASVPYMNPTNFQNSTFDSYRNQLLYSSTYSEVYNAAREMQKILHHNVPELVVYEETQYSAYRTNRFEGHVIDKFKNVENEWTNLKVHQNLMDGGPFNGTFRISLGQEPDSFNPMITNSYYSKVILANMYDSLFRIG